MRLYGRIARRNDTHPAILDVVRIDAQSISDYWHQHRLGHKHGSLADVFVSLMPPFPAMWIEFRATSTGLDVGSWIVAEEEDSNLNISVKTFIGDPRGFMEFGGFQYTCNDAGEVISNPLVEFWIEDDAKEWIGEKAESVMQQFIDVILLTLSFMHCRNVALEDAKPIGTRQQRRSAARKGVSDVQFKTLIIEPMKQVLRTEGQIEKVGLKRALHICRGHFQIYTEEKPMFGKYAGTFWVPAHVRGTEEAGKVFKDYAIKT